MKIALTLPLTSKIAERAFSKLEMVMSRLRTTMRQERLISLMLMSIEGDLLELDEENLHGRSVYRYGPKKNGFILDFSM